MSVRSCSKGGAYAQENVWLGTDATRQWAGKGPLRYAPGLRMGVDSFSGWIDGLTFRGTIEGIRGYDCSSVGSTIRSHLRLTAGAASDAMAYMAFFGGGGPTVARTAPAAAPRLAARTPISQLTNRELVQEIARRAERWGDRNCLPKAGGGHRQGSLKHGYAKRLLDRYQSKFGKRGLDTGVSWKDNLESDPGIKGSVRLDVFDRLNWEVFDYKFTPNARLSQARTQRLQQHGPRRAPIYVVTP